MTVASFTAINYSLRPSKTIQRSLVFEGLRILQEHLNWKSARYVGFGSIWFTDFVIAHKVLGLTRMISIESNLIGYRRAMFNKPYSFVRVKRGLSYDVIPQLFEQKTFLSAPSIIWLDYDSELDEDKIEELRNVVINASTDSVLLATFNTGVKHYGRTPNAVLNRLEELFGNFAVRRLDREDVSDEKLPETLATLTSNLISNTSKRMAKANACVPSFRIIYRDKASMATIGAVFPAEGKLRDIQRCVTAAKWPGTTAEPIIAPHLTTREVAVLQSKLPARTRLTRSDIRDLGFDLEPEQIGAFEQFYRHYPSFAQVLS